MAASPAPTWPFSNEHYSDISGEDGHAFNTDLIFLQKRPPTWRERFAKQQPHVKILLGLGLIVLLAASLVLVVLAARYHSSESTPQYFISSCMHALGGGTVGLGGDFLHFSKDCESELKRYFAGNHGPYANEVEQVGNAARAYFTTLMTTQTPDPSQVIVFDIDETALSNKGTFFQDTDDSGNWPKDQQHADSPALMPILGLYTFLYVHNYSVVFLTGRKELERQSTALNLAHAGYGQLCPNFTGDVISAPRPVLPCYVGLYLRNDTDSRLASMYKPDKRSEIAAAGYTIVGNIGDQYSDLVGPFSAPGSFKLPNPVYYIL